MKRLKGEITSKSNKEAFYTFVTSDGMTEVQIPFYQKQLLVKGDIVEINVTDDNEFESIHCVIENVYFKELQSLEGQKSKISAYVYAQNEYGFSVSYNGYRCFLPINQSGYKANKRENKFSIAEEIMYKTLDFFVLKIIDNQVLLTRIDLDKLEQKEKAQAEINTLEVGHSFLGKITGITDFGLIVENNYSSGLLYISEVLYFLKTDKEIGRAKPLFKVIMEEVFEIGDEINAEISSIDKNKYNLTWNETNDTNIKYWDKIMKLMHNESNFSIIGNYYYPRSETIDYLTVGQVLKGKIDKIRYYGLFVRLNNLSGLLHINDMVEKEPLESKYKTGEEITVVIKEINDKGIRLKEGQFAPHYPLRYF